MTVCYFGIYDPNYTRNRIFIKGLKQNGVQVIECATKEKGIKKYFDLIKKHKKIKGKYDCMIVGFPGQQCVILARFLTSKPIFFNALVSLYDSLVGDRKTVKKGGLKALYFWVLDWLACRFSTLVILDTETHADFFAKNFHLPKKKFACVLIGSDDDFVKPLENIKDEKFTVYFQGFFNPLQGVKYIIEAASILSNEKIVFNIIGKGQNYEKLKKQASDLQICNINFIDPVPYDKLKEYMSKAHICLGIFGETDKAARVIPNKVYDALASKMPIITSDTLAIKELLKDREDVLFCRRSDPKDLADKILLLKNDDLLRNRIAENGYSLFLNELRPVLIGKKLLSVLESNLF